MNKSEQVKTYLNYHVFASVIPQQYKKLFKKILIVKEESKDEPKNYDKEWTMCYIYFMV